MVTGVCMAKVHLMDIWPLALIGGLMFCGMLAAFLASTMDDRPHPVSRCQWRNFAADSVRGWTGPEGALCHDAKAAIATGECIDRALHSQRPAAVVLSDMRALLVQSRSWTEETLVEDAIAGIEDAIAGGQRLATVYPVSGGRRHV